MQCSQLVPARKISVSWIFKCMKHQKTPGCTLDPSELFADFAKSVISFSPSSCLLEDVSMTFIRDD